MESFATLIKSRRSTRKFTDQLLNPEQVEMILKAALMAPASKRKNPWQFVVVEDKEMLAKLSVCKPAGAAFLKDCALAVVVLANVMESDVWVEDASIASIYMQLQAEDLGLGSCFSDDGAHMDVFAHSRDSHFHAADASYQKIDLHAAGRSMIKS